MTIFFTGCTHFGHANIIKLAKRPFANVRCMDECLIENWNDTVSPRDMVYHLGDFAWRDPREYADRLNGNIIWLQGNHDPTGWGQDYIARKFNKRKWVMFHYPIEEWDGWFRKTAHVHAHTHKRELVSAERRFNVGVDACDYRPISIEDLEALI